MARLLDRYPENVPGDFYVDSSCIDCGVCRTIAPKTFTDGGGYSVVAAQPSLPADVHRAVMALVACPTSAIGTLERRLTRETRQAEHAFPEPLGDGIYFCGFASASSYGASSYLIVRPEGNVLVDSPRAARPLLDAIEALGGVRTMFLTHRDDVADHAKFHARFGCERVIAAADMTSATRDIERRLDGDAPVRLADDLLVVPTPGHTRGSATLLFREHALFTGDHLFATDDGRLYASRRVCWWSWAEQVRSVERLLAHRFEWVLPGHGSWFRAPSHDAMRGALRELVETLS